MRAVVALGLVALELDLLPQPIRLEIHHLHAVEHAQERMLRVAGEVHRDLRREPLLDQLRPERQRFERAIRDRAVLPVHHPIAVQVAGDNDLGHRQRQRLIRHGPVGPDRTPERSRPYPAPESRVWTNKPVVIEQHVVINRSRQVRLVYNTACVNGSGLASALPAPPRALARRPCPLASR